MAHQIKLSPFEETSIVTDINTDECGYSDKINLSLTKTLAMQTKIPDWIKFMSGMSGRKYRSFINNLVSMIDKPKYLEIGSWSGSTACSAIYDNELTVLCIDNWSQFNEKDKEHKSYGVTNPKETFESNIKKLISKKTNFKFIENDFRKVDYTKIGKYNIYLFDGPHEEKDQYDAIAIVQPALDDTFILIVDDWNMPKVRSGTLEAIKELKIKIISKVKIRTTQDDNYPRLVHGQFSDWHNGYLIAVCKKSGN